MPVSINYLVVLLIWSTTPLAITVSNQGFSAYASLTGRISLAFVLVAMIIALFRYQSALKKAHWVLYFWAGIGLFPNMLIVYQATEYLSSGLISVLFSLTPVTGGILAAIVLREAFFTVRKVSALGVAMAGVGIIFLESIRLDREMLTGIWLMLLSNLFFCISQVAVKYLQQKLSVDPLEQTFGSLTFALPGLVLSWFLLDGTVPDRIDTTSVLALIYLAVVGSLVASVAYFSILKRLSVALVSLIPLITPVLALWLGVLILDEQVTLQLGFGTCLIVVSVMIYDGSLLDSVRQRTGSSLSE